ncbi:hypothetical protein JYU34_000076, partial [Plutella xylostella]
MFAILPNTVRAPVPSAASGWRRPVVFSPWPVCKCLTLPRPRARRRRRRRPAAALSPCRSDRHCKLASRDEGLDLEPSPRKVPRPLM